MERRRRDEGETKVVATALSLGRVFGSRSLRRTFEREEKDGMLGRARENAARHPMGDAEPFER